MRGHDIDRLVRRLGVADAGEVFTLQLAAWVREAHENRTLQIPPLLESAADVERDLADPAVAAWGVRDEPSGRLLAMVRTVARDDGRTAFVGRLGAVPDLHGRGLGSALLSWVEAHVPSTVQRFELVTGARSARNHAFYERHGYVRVDTPAGPPGTVTYVKDATPVR